MDENTLFAIGSTTKAMTAALLGQLVEAGELAWDDSVEAHLPSFRLHDPWVTREVTIRDLLTHRAGLGNADLLWYGADRSREETMAKLALVEPAYSSPDPAAPAASSTGTTTASAPTGIGSGRAAPSSPSPSAPPASRRGSG